MLTISLTSVPPRFGGLGAVLASLMDQRAERVILWLPRRYDRFADWDGRLPNLPRGVELRRCDDFGPATKFVPILRTPSDNGDEILICDDDALYGPGWAESFRRARQTHPDAALAAHPFPVVRLGLRPAPQPAHLIAQGFAGVLLRRDMPDSRVCDIPADHRAVDDIWLSAHLAAAGTAIVAVPAARGAVTPQGASIAPLQDQTASGLTRAEANLASARALRQSLGIWRS